MSLKLSFEVSIIDVHFDNMGTSALKSYSAVNEMSSKTGQTSEPSLKREKPYSIDKDLLKKEVVIHTFRASGPGGQHRNVTDSGVRLVHPPSGVTVSATEARSQFRNRERAFERLIARLTKLNRIEKPRVPTKKSKAARERTLEEKHRIREKKRLRQHPEAEE